MSSPRPESTDRRAAAVLRSVLLRLAAVTFLLRADGVFGSVTSSLQRQTDQMDHCRLTDHNRQSEA